MLQITILKETNATCACSLSRYPVILRLLFCFPPESQSSASAFWVPLLPLPLLPPFRSLSLGLLSCSVTVAMAALLLAVGALPIATVASSTPHADASSRLSVSWTETLVGGAGRALSAPSSFLSFSMAATSPPQALPPIYCGRGDKKTAKGKRFKHSFGNARPRNKNKGRGPPRLPGPPAPPRKDKFDDGEIIKIEIDESLFS